jgi:DNA-binding HxlR family transcriptional regulator
MVHDKSLTGATREPARAGTAIPVAAMVESIVGCKWSLRLLDQFADGHSRPSELLRACPQLSSKVMNERLRKMLRFDIVERTVIGNKPPLDVVYVLTPFGRRFIGILDEVRKLQAALDEAGMPASN